VKHLRLVFSEELRSSDFCYHLVYKALILRLRAGIVIAMRCRTSLMRMKHNVNMIVMNRYKKTGGVQNGTHRAFNMTWVGTNEKQTECSWNDLLMIFVTNSGSEIASC
jgi:hypothetical protein